MIAEPKKVRRVVVSEELHAFLLKDVDMQLDAIEKQLKLLPEGNNLISGYLTLRGRMSAFKEVLSSAEEILVESKILEGEILPRDGG